MQCHSVWVQIWWKRRSFRSSYRFPVDVSQLPNSCYKSSGACSKTNPVVLTSDPAVALYFINRTYWMIKAWGACAAVPTLHSSYCDRPRWTRIVMKRIWNQMAGDTKAINIQCYTVIKQVGETWDRHAITQGDGLTAFSVVFENGIASFIRILALYFKTADRTMPWDSTGRVRRTASKSVTT